VYFIIKKQKNMEGFIYLHRKIKEWEWYKKPEVAHLFIHLLLSANHKDNEWQGMIIKRGQLITGLNSLSKDTGISVQTLRTCINRLKSTNEITSKSTNKFRLITIVNWNEYQSKLTDKSTSKLTINQQSTNNQLTTNNNDNNDNNENNISKEIVQAPQSYGNQDINLVYSHLKEVLGGTPDGTITENRRFAKLLLDKMKKDYPEKSPPEQIKALINFGLEDKFHSKNITNFKYLYYNSQKIIQSIKSKIKNPNIIKI
jgi:predicted transcriptional regulator